MIKEVIAKLTEFKNITAEEAASAMNEIMNGEATQAQIGAFLIALRMKGETIEEITGCAKVMREKADNVGINSEEAIDIVGTGGDCANTFNISTCSAFVVAASGVPVAKHGNRSVSSRCGSADVLEALGTNITLSPSDAAECMKETNICFMFAQSYHKSMKYVAGPRKELGLRTIFNILGPLANPARVQNQVLGVCDVQLLEPLTKALAGLGVRNIMTVNSQEGLDEISVFAPTNVCEYRQGQFSRYVISPQDYGINSGSLDDVRGGDAVENAEIIRNILEGKLKGAKRDIVLLNSGAALYIAGKAQSIKEGLRKAADVIDNGSAFRKLEEYCKLSNSMKEMAK